MTESYHPKIIYRHHNDAMLQGKLVVLESLVREVKDSIASRRADMR
ncbi:MAG: hypothetical protein KBD24_03215 [Candidatus Pacebacteria bacterium]|nr:hypothetical protein [Candidatus Paceibacterota bacterium]